ncbi:DNA polymerase III subunit beta [Acinetobacter baumannii]|uniref:DNA polymerase III subunit beta family protein n=1 Tax=Acinetobacter baumannii TaxID=470 RepID=UPI0022EB3A84|nr:DNA polymerase III subunit beta [Acinetobacter baumannii]MDA3322189.1 DNA polymerase III subunit beta [Acinetobacter baumannii]MDA3438565.1 DNA polymerase III subunit beta [Acinetobacter baumannii]MDA3594661.1 DNA polymerase III subunit beta [Acinetobacter baumannii]
MLNFKIPLAVLKAAIISAAKSDIRFYLQGVAIDKGNVVSTDGHRLFYVELDELDSNMQQVIIPREAIEYLSKKATGIKDFKKMVIVNLQGSNGKLTVQGTDIVENFQAIDGKFPEWQRIIPKADGSEYKGEYPTFNWQYLVDFQKIAKALGDKCKIPQVKVTPTIGPSNAAHIDFVDIEFKARGVLMPLRA